MFLISTRLFCKNAFTLRLTWNAATFATNSIGATAGAPTTSSMRMEHHPLLSAENRARCIEKFRRVPAFNRPDNITQQNSSEREQAYASVLIPLCNERGSHEISLLYTRRSGKLSRHSHQISFPGGLRDETDTDYIECALRETTEEIGLERSRVQIWGKGKLMRLPRTAAIKPVIGYIPDLDLSELELNMDEVDEVIIVPLSQLLKPSSARHTQFRNGFSGPVFVIDNHKHVWGITGFLTHVFLRCLLPASDCEVLNNNIKYVRPYKVNHTHDAAQTHAHHHHST